MKAIVCDRCGKVEHEYCGTTISYPYGHCMGEPDEQHLCGECRKDLLQWMKEEPT